MPISCDCAARWRSRCSPTIRRAISLVLSTGDQRAFSDELPEAVNCRESMPLRQCHDEPAMSIQEWVRRDDQSTARLARKRRGSCFDLRVVVHRCLRKLDGERGWDRSEFPQEEWCPRRGEWVKQK